MDLRSFVPKFFNNVSYFVGFSMMPIAKNIYNNERNNSTIDICSNVIANTVASIPIGIYKEVNGFTEALKEDYRYSVLHTNPNDYTTSYTFWHTMEKVKQKEGNSFAVIHKFPETNSIILEFIHPSLLAGNPRFEEGFLKYDFKIGNGVVTYDSGSIIHFKRDSDDGIMGKNPYTVLNEEVKRSYLANKTITNYYENDGKSTKFLKTKFTTGDKARLEESVDRFRKESGGTYIDENGKRITADFDKIVAYPRLPGDSEIQVIPNDQNDALYLATVQSADLKIASYYQLPPHYLNILQAQKDSNVQTMQLDFKSSTIQHTLRANRQELELKLLTSDERKNGLSIEYNTMAILELSIEERMRSYESLQKTAFLTPNEVRQKEGLPSIKGGDENYIFNQFTTLDGLKSSKNTTTN